VGLPQNDLIVVYCVRGREVSRGVATQLDKLGHKVLYLEGVPKAGVRWGEGSSQSSSSSLTPLQHLIVNYQQLPSSQATWVGSSGFWPTSGVQNPPP